MSSKREQILAKFKTVLLAATQTPAGDNVFRSRMEAVTTGMLPAIVIRPGARDMPSEDTNGKVDRFLDVEVSVLQQGAIPDSLADATVVAAHAKIMADRTLGGLAIDVVEQPTAFAFDRAEKDGVEVSMNYQVHYRTDADDLET